MISPRYVRRFHLHSSGTVPRPQPTPRTGSNLPTALKRWTPTPPPPHENQFHPFPAPLISREIPLSPHSTWPRNTKGASPWAAPLSIQKFCLYLHFINFTQV